MTKKRIGIFFLSYFGVSALLVVLLCFLLLESKPEVPNKLRVSTDQAADLKEFANTTFRRLHDLDEKEVALTASQADLNSVIAFASRGIDRLSGEARFSPDLIAAAFTIRVAPNPFGRYLNIRLAVAPSPTSLNVARAQIGGLRIPGTWFCWVARVVLDRALGNETGTSALAAIKGVTLENGIARITLNAVPDILERKQEVAQRFSSLRDALPQVADPEVVRGYYARLIALEEALPENAEVSLTYFLAPLFQRVKAHEEGKAALLALLIFAGSHRFEKIIGEVRTPAMRQRARKNLKITLSKRRDLSLHFIFSAGLKIFSRSGISYSIGEFKELMDAGTNSGFSFADLAADMAGVRLAEAVITPSPSLPKVVTALSNCTDESVFFPNIDGLPEDLSKAEFDHQYTDVYSPAYMKLVEKSRQRISALPLYSGQAQALRGITSP